MANLDIWLCISPFYLRKREHLAPYILTIVMVNFSTVAMRAHLHPTVQLPWDQGIPNILGLVPRG